MPRSGPRRADERLSVLVCRGCCCGTIGKHPDVSHSGHLARLQAAVGQVAGAKLFVVDCLDHCERSNVVVVRSGGIRRWFGEMLDDSTITELAAWLDRGGDAPVPVTIRGHLFDPDGPPAPPLRMDGRTGDELAEWLDALVSAGGAWPEGIPDDTADLHAFVVGSPDEPSVAVLVVFARLAGVGGRATHRSFGTVVDDVPALPFGLQLPTGFELVATHVPATAG